MPESILNKEFKESDVNRIRNIVKRDFSSKTKIQIGYKKAFTEYKEGEVWEEDGRTWTIKNGIKKTIPKHTSVKSAVKIPLTCPKCERSMRHHLHKKMYKIHGFCFDCTIEYEAELRKNGLYEQYEKSMIKQGVKAFGTDLESWVREVLDRSTSQTFITEEGDVEDWKFAGKEFKQKNLEKLQEFLKYINGKVEE